MKRVLGSARQVKVEEIPMVDDEVEEEEEVIEQLPFNCPRCSTKVLLNKPPRGNDDLYCQACIGIVKKEREIEEERERQFLAKKKKENQSKKIIIAETPPTVEETIDLDGDPLLMSAFHECNDGYQSRMFKILYEDEDENNLVIVCAECGEVFLSVTKE